MVEFWRRCLFVWKDFRIKWIRRRYLWRASFFYNCVSCILVVGLFLTFILHYLITKYSFFVNYSCSARSSKNIVYSIMTQMILIGTLLLITILLGRLCNLFSNYSLEECRYSKRLITVLGFTIKWLPSIAGFLMATLFILQFACLIWTLANSRQWCVNRFNEATVNAVKNCRLIHQSRAACKLDYKITTKKEIRECNNAGYLINKRLIMLALSDEDRGCNIEDIVVCHALASVFEGKDVNWHADQLMGCLGRLPKQDESLLDNLNPSDLYRFLLLFHTTGVICSTLIIVFFYVVRFITEYDAMIYQPRNSSDNCFIKFIRPLTMWS
ncbi:uncharacterized protein BXIN_0202 [Babesia sp. Xinjiang]|uniref:uncharacterized protein n=1 Tax=Babesia sp. Xinjiang TaxID=462227 RepID=UPI000A24067D|nr:uncharacterized protein BXIN_0202 [Babesia sp. Xinjiang]ORM39797.1 hypothetical protein BXIN_0202 [Babesia sp. Xinjiang]